MLSMSELMDIRMQQQIAEEIYRQQILQRIPDPFSVMLSMHMSPHHVIAPPRCAPLSNVKAKLENNELWNEFHKIGTEMIITKTGRRMFPSQRVSLAGLEAEASYCVLLEMVPIGNCRYKFSGSQWVPAGGLEPQSPQRMFLHPDSPSTGAHWQSQPILFNKVKLTNNTMDHSGQIVLASMHKYQPRIHVIRTSDLSQIPSAPQQAFVFPETQFIAVTAYQNDRITRLKIDNNPFAKGFRETGQARCKRKVPASAESRQSPSRSPNSNIEDDRSSVSSCEAPQSKRFRSCDFMDDASSVCSSRGSRSPHFDEVTRLYSVHPSELLPMPLEMPTPYFIPSIVPAGCPVYLKDQQLMAKAASTASAAKPSDMSIAPNRTNYSSQSEAGSTKKRSNFSISAILAY